MILEITPDEADSLMEDGRITFEIEGETIDLRMQDPEQLTNRPDLGIGGETADDLRNNDQ